MGFYMVNCFSDIIRGPAYTAHSHLLITRPTKSRALECFVVETAQRSTHIALIVRNQTNGMRPSSDDPS